MDSKQVGSNSALCLSRLVLTDWAASPTASFHGGGDRGAQYMVDLEDMFEVLSAPGEGPPGLTSDIGGPF